MAFLWERSIIPSVSCFGVRRRASSGNEALLIGAMLLSLPAVKVRHLREQSYGLVVDCGDRSQVDIFVVVTGIGPEEVQGAAACTEGEVIADEGALCTRIVVGVGRYACNSSVSAEGSAVGGAGHVDVVVDAAEVVRVSNQATVTTLSLPTVKAGINWSAFPVSLLTREGADQLWPLPAFRWLTKMSLPVWLLTPSGQAT